MQCWLQEAIRRDASINDVHLLDSGRRPTERRLSSSGFRGQVDVLLNNGVQRFQPLEEGQRLSVLAGLVVAYVDDFLVYVDVQVDISCMVRRCEASVASRCTFFVATSGTCRATRA